MGYQQTGNTAFAGDERFAFPRHRHWTQQRKTSKSSVIRPFRRRPATAARTAYRLKGKTGGQTPPRAAKALQAGLCTLHPAKWVCLCVLRLQIYPGPGLPDADRGRPHCHGRPDGLILWVVVPAELRYPTNERSNNCRNFKSCAWRHSLVCPICGMPEHALRGQCP